VANFLYDDLKLQRGDRIAALTRNDTDTALILFGAWVIGLSVILLPLDSNDEQLRISLHESRAKVCFTDAGALARIDQLMPDLPSLMGQVEVGGTPCEDYINFHEVIRSRPTTYLGDDSGAKAADLSLREGNERTATFADEALYLANDLKLTQGQLLYAAKSLAEAQGFTGNQRHITTGAIQTVEGLVAGLLVPLVVGGSVVWCEDAAIDDFWARIVREKVNTAHITPHDMQALIDHSEALRAEGMTVYGHGINRTNMARFRHVICNGRMLSRDVIRAFESLYGFPVLVGYSSPVAGGFVSLLPMMLSWEAHQDYLHNHDTRCLGVSLPGYDVALDDTGLSITLPDGSQVHEAVKGTFKPDARLGVPLLFMD
jgi:acyl-coenzyme A synthetase/AMP-(fatty) acid ligase